MIADPTGALLGEAGACANCGVALTAQPANWRAWSRECWNMSIRMRATGPERVGVDFTRTPVERANCVFKEIHCEDDYGHDVFNPRTTLLREGSASPI